MDHGLDIAALDRDTARPGEEPETGLADTGLATVDALIRSAQRSLVAHGQILTGADFARSGQPDERLDKVLDRKSVV